MFKKVTFFVFFFVQIVFADLHTAYNNQNIAVDSILLSQEAYDSSYASLVNLFKSSDKIYDFTKKHSYAISLTDCLNQNVEGKWIPANGGTLKFFTRDPSILEIENAVYEWEGSSFKDVIHGDGVLIQQEGDSVTRMDVNAYFGSISSKDVINLPHGLYIGDVYDLSLDGYGVFLDSLCLYIGKFSNGFPTGKLDDLFDQSWFCKESWQKEHSYGHLKLPQNSAYEGFIKDGKPDGFGRIENSFEVANAFFEDGKINGPFYIKSIDEDLVNSGIKSNDQNLAVVEISNEENSFSQKIWKNGSIEAIKVIEQINDNLRRKFEKKKNHIFEEYVFEGKLGDIYDGPETDVFSYENLEENVHFVGSLSYDSHMIIDGSCKIRFVDKNLLYEGYCSNGKILALKEKVAEEDESAEDVASNDDEETSSENGFDDRLILQGIYEGDKYVGSIYDEDLVAMVLLDKVESHADVITQSPRFHYRGKPSTLLRFSLDKTVKCGGLINCPYLGGFDEDSTAKIAGTIEYNIDAYGMNAPIVSSDYGTLSASNGESKLFYMGLFSDGKFDGYGRLLVEGFFEYEGEFKDGKIEGNGKLTAKNFFIPNLKYVDKEIKSITGVWNGLNSVSQFFVIETIDGEKIDMVVEPDQVIPVSKSERVKKTIGDKSIAKLVQEHHGKITVGLVVASLGSGLVCSAVAVSSWGIGFVPCIAVAESAVFALQSVVEGFVLIDQLKTDCYGVEKCKDDLIKKFWEDRLVDAGLTAVSIATAGVAGKAVESAKAAKVAGKAAEVSGDVVKAAKVISTMTKFTKGVVAAERITDRFMLAGRQVLDRFGNLVLDLSKIGKESFAIAEKLVKEYGDDVIKSLVQVAEKNPGKIPAALRYMEAKGIEGVRDVLKWRGAIPGWLTKGVIETVTKIAGSTLKVSAEAMGKLPGIRLTTSQLDNIRMNPKYLETLVRELTGKSFKDGYLEFFVRLAKNNADQANEIWNYSKSVRDFIKDFGIRGESVHEWLMCAKFMEFLTDPKWRDLGVYLAKIQTVLVQKTDDVYMILADGSKWSHKMEKFGNGVIHKTLEKVINESHSAEELLVKLDEMVMKNFPKEVYDKFAAGLAECFK